MILATSRFLQNSFRCWSRLQLSPLRPRQPASSLRRFRTATGLEGSLSTPLRQDIGPATNPENEAIKAFKIYIVQEDGGLGEAMILQHALEQRKKDERGSLLESLRQVRAPDRDIMFPVCRYINMKEERDKERAQKKAQRDRRMKGKDRTVNLNWTISENDLGHWMSRVKDFLSKGSKVEVVIGSDSKPGWKMKRAEGPKEARRLIDNIENMAREAGSKKIKEVWRGRFDQEVVLYFEPPKQ